MTWAANICTFTSQLHDLRDWLLGEGVHSIAMEATGVYWLSLYGVLEAAGPEVVMVNGRQTRNLPGRKTDMKGSQWGATLHAHGLLKAGFVPPAHIPKASGLPALAYRPHLFCCQQCAAHAKGA